MIGQGPLSDSSPVSPDPWLDNANPWEIPRLDVTVDIRFGGHAEKLEGGRGIWSGGQEVLAVAYDCPIPGSDTKSTNNIRFWSARPRRGFDLQSFNGA
jgi:starch phosphorylase